MTAIRTKEIGWNHPETVEFYEAFCQRHDRYAIANGHLIAQAELIDDQRILDVAAGTGRTSAAVLASGICPGSILCFEPAAAMLAVGRQRLSAANVEWTEQFPSSGEFDRILCGAAIWQLSPLDQTIARLSKLLAPGGSLCFNIPALYLGEPDSPGDGKDPLLFDLLNILSRDRERDSSVGPPVDEPTSQAAASLSIEVVESMLRTCGLHSEWRRFQLRFDQTCLREWLKIPILTNRLLSGRNSAERARLIDEACQQVDPTSYRWERWVSWRAGRVV